MSEVLDFFNGLGTPEGFTIHDVWKFDRETLEKRHDYIQYLFPLDGPSSFNSGAPIVTPEVIRAFKRIPLLQSKLRRNFYMMLKFYGLEYHPRQGIIQGPHFNKISKLWITPGNHNFLRITRMISSLGLLGLLPEGQAFFVGMCNIYHQHKHIIGRQTGIYWVNAAKKYLLASRGKTV